MNSRYILGIGLLLMLVLIHFVSFDGICQPSASSTLYVGGSGLGNFTTIQQAIDNASIGDSVVVFAGTSHEHVIITKSLVLRGENKDTTMIDGDNQSSVVILQADGCNLTGFTIIHSGIVFPSAGVLIQSNNNTVSGTILTENYYGMRLSSGTGYNMVSGNEIYRNKQCGVYFSRSSHNTFVANYVSTQPFNGFGVYENSNDNVFQDNVLSSNNYAGINLRDSYRNLVIKNHFSNDRRGLHLPLPQYMTVASGNVFSENHVDVEQEADPLLTIGAGVGFLFILGFVVLWKWKT